MRRVLILLRKDWREIYLQRGLVIALLAPPLFLTLMPIIVSGRRVRAGEG